MTSSDDTDPGADMPDRSAAPEHDTTLEDEPWEAPSGAESDPLPPRRARRRLVTPLTAGLAAVVLATAGFIAGVQVQKGQAGTGTGTASAGAANATARAGFRGGRGAAGGGAQVPGGGGAQAQDAPTVGSVANKRGSTLYVQDADGTTVRVRTDAQSKVTRTTAASPGAVHPGDTVVVQGTKGKDGTIVATQITATSKSAAANGGGGLRQAFGGAGGAPPAGAAPAGTVPAG
jgi:hypothetical protein